jgi:hypothetical protein
MSYGTIGGSAASLNANSLASSFDEAKRQPEVDEALANLEFWAGQVGQSLDHVYSRLAMTVLAPPLETGVGSAQTPSNCILAGRIKNTTERLVQFQNLLREIESRLEI